MLGIIWNVVTKLGRKPKRPAAATPPSSSPAPPKPGADKSRARKRWFVPPATAASGLLLGGILLVASAKLYSDIVSPSQAPIVPGLAQLYVTNPAVTAYLGVEFPMKSDTYGDSQVNVALTFYNNNNQAKSVTWALVMYGDSCLAENGTCLRSATEAVETTLPSGSNLRMVQIGQSPFSANPKDTMAQIVYSTTYFNTPVGRAGASIILGHIAASVVDSSGPEWDMTLPSYGRLQESPIFDFPNRPGALDLSIPGHWYRPANFEVDVTVNSPGNDSDHRVDVASPPLADPQFLAWTSGESVRGIVQRTDLSAAAHQQILIFLLGAIVGAGASMLLLIFQWPIEGAFGAIVSRALRPSRGAQAKRARAD
jgi:hypothetical protein